MEKYINHVHELEKIYMPYAIFNEAGEIIAFSENMPQSARLAAKEHMEISAIFDDISNIDYWEKLLIKLNLK